MEDRLNEAFSEAILKYAVIENHRREMEAIPSDEELANLYTFSERHEKRMEKLFASYKRKEILSTVFRVARRSAAAIIIAIAFLFGVLLASPTVRAAVMQTVVEWYEKFTGFQIAGNAGTHFVEWTVEYVPLGFVEVDRISFGDNGTMITWRNANGIILHFDYRTGARGIGIDNEHQEYTTKRIDGIEFHIFSANVERYHSFIIWENAGHSFVLESAISSDELLKMALSAIPEVTS